MLRRSAAYAMGCDVSQLHGVQTISHDGSGFGSHANVVLVPERKGASW